MGFPPGVSQRLLLQAFKKYEKAAQQQREIQKKQQQITKATMASSDSLSTKSNTQSSTLHADTPESAQVQAPETHIDSPPPTDVIQSPEANTQQQSSSHSVICEPSIKKPDSDEMVIESSPDAHTSSKDNSVAAVTNNEAPDDSTRQQKMFQANPDSYNGAVRDTYSWSQSITDIDIKIFVPDHIRKGRDVLVDIKRKHMCARCKNPAGDWHTLVEGDLMWEVNKEESMWSLEPGKNILVNLEKVQERWWESILTSEPKINVRNIEASRPMTELDDEAQCKIEEMMYNERQKKLGLPQSHEQKVNEMLKKAWDVEGSPFRGQPFDPSQLNISPEGAMNFGAK